MNYLYTSTTVVMTRIFIKRFFIGKISLYVNRSFKKQHCSTRILSLGFVNFYPRVSLKIYLYMLFRFLRVRYPVFLNAILGSKLKDE